MNENGADIEKAKGEVETLRNQLNETQDKLKSFEGVDVAKLRGEITNLTNVNTKYHLEYEKRVLLANTRLGSHSAIHIRLTSISPYSFPFSRFNVFIKVFLIIICLFDFGYKNTT